MKTFIYKTEHKNAKYGSNVTISIYQLKRNKPVFLGEVFYNTGSYMGTKHEVNKFLVTNKHLPKSYSRRSGYINYDFYGEDKKYYFYSI